MKLRSRLNSLSPDRPALGFTLIELMTVVVVISILAAIAFTKYGELLRKSKEGALQGNLGSIRSAISIYYADLEGQFPADLQSLTVGGRYLAGVPVSEPPQYHAASNLINAAFGDAGGWVYESDSSDDQFGSVWVNCSHTDTKASTWSSY